MHCIIFSWSFIVLLGIGKRIEMSSCGGAARHLSRCKWNIYALYLECRVRFILPSYHAPYMKRWRKKDPGKNWRWKGVRSVAGRVCFLKLFWSRFYFHTKSDETVHSNMLYLLSVWDFKGLTQLWITNAEWNKVSNVLEWDSEYFWK